MGSRPLNIMQKQNQAKPDTTLLVITSLLILFGLLMLSSASTVVAFERHRDSYFFLKHQIVNGLIPGLVFGYLLYRLDYHRWQKWSRWLYFLALGLLLLVFIPGLGRVFNNARSWVDLRWFVFQPSEIVKLLLIIVLASWLDKHADNMASFKRGFIPFVLLFGFVAALVLLQPDVGTLCVMTAIVGTMYFVAGAPLWHLGVASLAGLAGLAGLIFAAPYRLARFVTFWNPAHDPQGAGYQLNQALIAIGSGGFLGLGLGHSRQKFMYLPEVTADSIFAVVTEELGFLLSSLVVIAFFLLLWRGFKLLRGVPDRFGFLVGVGILSWVGWQAFVNMAAIVGLMPLTGVPLPLVSYGGTSFAVLLGALGLLFQITREA